MEISKGLEIIGTALWIKEHSTIVINDLHLGYEESLQKKGILVPKSQINQILEELGKIIKATKAETVIINGDLKHEFGTVLKQEWKDVLQLLDFLLKKCSEVIIIQGNHDPIIAPIANKRNVKVNKQYRLGKMLIVHGDELVETDAEIIILGHEHTAITLNDGTKWEKYKCFLKGKWKSKELIVVPSFNPLLEGTDILKEKMLSPFFQDIKNFRIYIINKGETFDFGKVKDIKKLYAN